MSYTDARVGAEAVKQTVELKRIAEALERTAEAAEVANLLTVMGSDGIIVSDDVEAWIVDQLRDRLGVPEELTRG